MIHRAIIKPGMAGRVGPMGLMPVSNFGPIRRYSDEVIPAKKKKKRSQLADISQIPIKSIGVIADFYVPPRFLSSPITSWHKLIFRRFGLFAINTYSVVKYRRETGLKLKFADWKESAIEKYVRMNKVFAASCGIAKGKREEYVREQLDGVAGLETIKSLVNRAKTLPQNSRIDWQLLKIESNPRTISFGALPDSNNITAYVQLVLQLKTRQKFTVTNLDTKESHDTERVLKNNLVYTLDPYTDEIVLVGSLFESDHVRGVQPEINFNNAQLMASFQAKCADVFRNQEQKPN